MERINYLWFVLCAAQAACAGSSTTPPTSGSDAHVEIGADVLADAPLDTETSDALPCTPIVHDTQGFVADLHVQRYRFVGAKADGARVAVLRSHFGPSSGSPFAVVEGFEQANTAPLFQHLCFMMDPGTEELLRQCEEKAIADSLDDFTRFEIEFGRNLPTPRAWCDEANQIYVAEPALRLRWTSADRPCGDAQTAEQWRACDVSDGHCIDEEADDCDQGIALAPVDVFASESGVVWIVGARTIDPFSSGELFYTRMLGGGTFGK